jgi:hypothetical protein
MLGIFSRLPEGVATISSISRRMSICRKWISAALCGAAAASKPRFQGGQRPMHRRRFFLGAVRAVLAGDKGGHIVGWTFDTIERR